MRLLVITQYFWPENFRINDLVGALSKRGHSITVLTGYPNYPGGIVFPEFKSHPEHYRFYEGAEVIRVPLLPRGNGSARLALNYLSFALSASLFGPRRLRTRDFDVILTYEPSPITVGIPAAIMRRLKQAPMAFWVLDLWPESLRAVGKVRSRSALRLVGSLVTFVYRNSDLILAQSRSFEPEIIRYGGQKERIRYFPNWAESVFAQSTAPAVEVPLQDDAFNVMFAGNIGDAQDFPSILNAADKLRSNRRICWLIVGDGRMASWVRSEIERRGLQEQVIMLGKHPVERMPSFFQHADALLVSLKDQPIFAMTIPGKLQSYLAAGVPIVGMLNGEGADVIKRAKAGVVCPAGDADGLAQAILQLASSPKTLLDEMRTNGRAYGKLEFDRDTLIDRIEGWLSELASSGRFSNPAEAP